MASQTEPLIQWSDPYDINPWPSKPNSSDNVETHWYDMMRQMKKQSFSYNLMSFPSLKYKSFYLLGSDLQIKLAFDAPWCQNANIFNIIEIIMQTARGHWSNFLYGDVLHPFSCTHCLLFRPVWNGKDFCSKLLSEIAPSRAPLMQKM